MKKNIFKKIILSLLIFSSWSLPVLATPVFDLVGRVGGNAGYNSGKTPEDIVAIVIQMILGFLGVLFIVLIIVGGFQWMTASGNEETIKKAQRVIKNAVIGLLVVMLSYAASIFVIKAFLNSIN